VKTYNSQGAFIVTMYEKIQYLCDEKNIKLAHLCKEANVPKSTLSELKQGRTKTLSTQTLSKIANYFGVSLDYFDIDSVDDAKDELFEKRKLLFDMSKKATKEQLDTFLVMFKAVIDDDSNNK
jgi:transcriptional regulator with XRE-family HTH domain